MEKHQIPTFYLLPRMYLSFLYFPKHLCQPLFEQFFLFWGLTKAFGVNNEYAGALLVEIHKNCGASCKTDFKSLPQKLDFHVSFLHRKRSRWFNPSRMQKRLPRCLQKRHSIEGAMIISHVSLFTSITEDSGTWCKTNMLYKLFVCQWQKRGLRIPFT